MKTSQYGSSTTLRRLRQAKWLSSTLLFTILFSLIAPAFERTARAQSVPDPSSLPGPNTGVQQGQTDLSAPETGPSANIRGSVDTATGAFQTSIPFILPIARGAVQPTLSLDYSSSGPRGVGGLGWSLSVPSIERHNPSGAPNYANDPAVGARITPVASSGIPYQDQFTYAGQPLVPICFLPDDYPSCVQHEGQSIQEKMPSWAMTGGWHYYRLETDTGSNLRFYWAPNHLTWVVQVPDGSTMEFGAPQDNASDTSGIDTDPTALAIALAAAPNGVTVPCSGSTGVCSQMPVSPPFRYNMVRQYDAQRLPGTSHPSNLIVYKWSTLAQPGTIAVPGTSAGTDPAFLASLTDIYDTPSVGAFPPAPTSFAHHAHLTYVNDPTWLAPNSSPVWRARPVMRLTGVDVTSQTFAGGGAREQVRRYVLSYAWNWDEFELHEVQVDGWCASGDPFENASGLLPTESSTPVCGIAGASGQAWPPPTVFTYNAAGGVAAASPPVPVFHTIPGSPAGPPPAGANTLPTILDLNADGMPDIIFPASSTGWQVASLNSANGVMDQWYSIPMSLLYPTLGVDPQTLGPWSRNYAGGAFQNNSQVSAGWFDSTWANTSVSQKWTVPGVTYVTYSPPIVPSYQTTPNSLDWGLPVQGTVPSVFPGLLQNCNPVSDGAGGTANLCVVGPRFIGGDQAFAVLDVDGDGLQDLLVTDEYGVGTFAYGAHDRADTSTFFAALNVKFSERSEVGAIYPFAAPLPQQTQSYIPANSNALTNGHDVPNVWIGGVEDANTLTQYPWTIGDINGDGLPDFIQLTVITTPPTFYGVLIYFGHGDGVFGQCDIEAHASTIATQSVACTGPQAITALSRTLPANPVNANAKLNAQFHDVDGDGLADAIIPTSDGFDVYPNVAGDDFPGPAIHVIAAGPLGWTNTSATSSWQTRVYMFADMDASGVDDVVIADASGKIGYVDMLGGPRPGLMTAITSTTGATTNVQYKDIPTLSRAAAAAGRSWLTQSAESRNVVTQISMTDTTPGIPTVPVTTTYTYRDPMYDARDRQFVGFTTVDAATTGDASAPTSHARTTFFQGFCDNAVSGKACPNTADYPNRALRALPILTETFGGTELDNVLYPGGFLSTVHRSFTESPAYTGLDGRSAHVTWVAQTDTYSYDNSATQVTASSQQQLLDVLSVSTNTSFKQVTFGTTGAPFHTQTSYSPDLWGEDFSYTDSGQVDASGNSLDGIVQYSEQSTPALNDSVDNWIWRPNTETLTGLTASLQPTGVPRATSYFYDSRGNLQTVQAVNAGDLPMQRTTAVTATGDAGTLPPTSAPPTASASGTVVLEKITVDPQGTGNITFVEEPTLARCRGMTYDTPFSQLVTSSTVYLHGCNSAGLATAFTMYARGLALVTAGSTSDGQASQVKYESYGRPSAVYRPDPMIPGQVETVAGVSYDYGDTSSPRKIHTVLNDGTATHDFWTVLDGYGRARLSAAPADVSAGDQFPWIVSGQIVINAKGAVQAAYPPSFVQDWTTAAVVPSGAGARTVQYDAFGRTVAAADVDSTVTLKETYQANGFTRQDAEQVKAPGTLAPHAGNSTTVTNDGHGRRRAVVATGNGGSVATGFGYLPTGEPFAIDRLGTDAAGHTGHYQRWMQYDARGRLVLNAEPSTTTGFVLATRLPISAPPTLHGWTYAYDDAGDLVATTDARGCGENIAYDAAGRVTGEDYFGCTPTHLPYTPPNTSTGAGFESFYVYDSAGHLSDVFDRAAHSHYSYDARSRVTAVERNLVQPGVVPIPTSGYAPHTFTRALAYDDLDRAIGATTGEDLVTELNGTSVSLGGETSTSAVLLHYSQRGALASISGSFGPLIRQNVFAADGLPVETSVGDIAAPPSGSSWSNVLGTQTIRTYDTRRRLLEFKTARQAPALWSSAATATYAPPAPTTSTQTVLEDDVYSDDAVGNPEWMGDGRIAGEWSPTSQPFKREPITYDDFYRVSGMGYTYAGNAYASPEPASTNATDPFPLMAASTRIGRESFAYDPLGNLLTGADDQGVFFDRTLGTVAVGSTGAAGAATSSSTNQVVSASLATGANPGNLAASYDQAGNLEQIALVRSGACASPDGCSQLLHYEWDEVGHLAHAQRFDFLPVPKCTGRVCPEFVLQKNGSPYQYTYPSVPGFTPGADVKYAYDAAGARTLQTSLQADGTSAYTADIFPSLRLDHTTFGTQSTGDYDRSSATDRVYLVAGGSSVGQVVFAEGDPTPAGAVTAGQHVLLELGDALGSTASLVDQGTGELVERTTYTAYGQVESDYTSDRWGDFRSAYKFTGKEDDVDLGMTYFGARYYSPHLGTWMSPDPLAIHGLSGDLNAYAYVHGRTTTTIDPTGLDGSACLGQEDCDAIDTSSLDIWWDDLGGDVSRGWHDLLHLGSSSRPPPVPRNPGNTAPTFVPMFSARGMQLAMNGQVDQSAVAGFNEGISRNSGVLTGLGVVGGAQVGLLMVGTGGAAMDALGSAWTATDTMLGTAANGVTNFVSNGLGYFGRVIAAGFGAAVAQNCFEAGTLVAMCDGGQQPIETLREGDQVASMADDGSIECRAITKTFERIAEDRATVVVDSDKGTDALHTTLGHRFWVENRGWVSVHEIAAGDFLRSEAGSASSVRSVDVESGAARVFNLEVAQNHTYFVGASRALAHNTCGDAAEGATYAEGSFSVIDWTGYPEGMPRPDGALRVLSGDEYAAARALANETNAGIRAANGLEGSGLQIHEIQPVKFGGSPTDMANKMLLPTAEHIGPDGVHPQFWQPLLQWVTGGGG